MGDEVDERKILRGVHERDIKFRLDAKLSELAPWRRVDATLARDTVDHVLDGVKPIPELVRIFGKHEAQEEHVRRHREALKDLFRAYPVHTLR